MCVIIDPRKQKATLCALVGVDMNVFIACSASEKIENHYYDEMKNICNMLCDVGYDLLFSPYNKGMLSICYETFKQRNKKISGYTIEQYKSSLDVMPGVDCIIEDSSFDRLKAFYNDCDLFIFMPGGSGTIGELFGMIEEGKNNLQNKKIVLYNYNNFFKGLFDFINEKKATNFIAENDLKSLIIINNFDELKDLVNNK